MFTTRRVLAFSLVAFFLAGSILAAPIRSPYRHAAAATLTARRAFAGEQWLDFDPAALAALRSAPAGTVEIANFPVSPGVEERVVLRRFEVASPDARITVTGKGGDALLPLPSIAHFAGTIESDPASRVYLSAQEGQLVGWIRSKGEFSYVGPDESGSGYIVRAGASPRNARYASTLWSCGAEDLPEAPQAPAPAASTPDLVGFQRAKVIVETDQELLAKFSGDVGKMSAYVLTIFGAFDLIYERDLSFHLTVVEIHAWTTPDPWDGPSTSDQLVQLGDWYHANRPLGTFPRATVHLMSGITVTGGIAYRPALCIADFDRGDTHWGGAYGVSQVFADYPAEIWDILVTTHEIGHNAGSAHTHCYVPEIDQCYNLEPGCYSGPTSVPPGGGTIMSYCHLLPGGLANINLVFHPRCISEQLLPYIQAAACTGAIATFPDVPVTHPFFHFVETIYQLGITGGCTGGNYCPTAPVFRQQMAVFLLKAKFGSAHVPPACTGTVFTDVPCTGGPFDPWIEELFTLGIAGGCGPGMFCPTATVTRKQMAPFLLKTLYGSGHVPPTPTGIFQDVPIANNPFAPFIEELYGLGITGGCQSAPLLYCPDNPNTRGQMAVFLTKTFSLTW
jgi:hypothetical protein